MLLRHSGGLVEILSLAKQSGLTRPTVMIKAFIGLYSGWFRSSRKDAKFSLAPSEQPTDEQSWTLASNRGNQRVFCEERLSIFASLRLERPKGAGVKFSPGFSTTDSKAIILIRAHPGNPWLWISGLLVLISED